MVSRLNFLAALLALGVIAFPAAAADYHLDADTGHDAHSGLSPDQAWKTLAPANARTFQPGDRILLKAGTHYAGQLAPKGSGALLNGQAQPITLAMYGQGDKPRIDGEGAVLDTLLIHNVDYWNIRDLEITNKGAQTQPWRTGVHILVDAPAPMRAIHLSGLYVHDVNGDLRKSQEGCGIYFETRGPPGGRGRRGAATAAAPTLPATSPATRPDSLPCFDDLLIENCRVVRTDRNGICQRTTGGARSTRVVIRNNLLEDIGGDGIKLWGSDGGLVEHNVLRGGHMRCQDAAAGIWPFASDNSLIQFNEVSAMKTTSDGQGFDSDYQCRGSIFQFNYSHDNDGGFMLICSPGNSYCQGTIIRYNVSQNDGLGDSYTFNIDGNTTDTLIHNNIIYVGPRQKLPLLHYMTWANGNPQRTSFFNNIFYVDGKVSYVWGKSTDNVFDHNIFHGNHVDPPSDPHAVTAKPALVNPGGGADGFKSLAAYQWLPNAAVPRGKLIPITAPHDFFGNLIPNDRDPCLGIHEVSR